MPTLEDTKYVASRIKATYTQGPVCHDRAKTPIADPKLLRSCREGLTEFVLQYKGGKIIKGCLKCLEASNSFYILIVKSLSQTGLPYKEHHCSRNNIQCRTHKSWISTVASDLMTSFREAPRGPCEGRTSTLMNPVSWRDNFPISSSRLILKKKTFHFRSTDILPLQFLIPKPIRMLTAFRVSFCDSPNGGSRIKCKKKKIIGRYEKNRLHWAVKCTNTRIYEDVYSTTWSGLLLLYQKPKAYCRDQANKDSHTRQGITRLTHRLLAHRRGKISDFCRDIDEIFALLGCYAAYVRSLSMFRDSL